MKLATLLHDLFLYIPKFNFEGAYTWSAATPGLLKSAKVHRHKIVNTVSYGLV